MSNTTLSIRTDDRTKAAIKAFADSLGLSVSTFATVAMKRAMSEGKLLLSPLEPSPYLEKIMREAEAELDTDCDVTTISNQKELDNFFEDLGQNDLKTQQKI